MIPVARARETIPFLIRDPLLWIDNSHHVRFGQDVVRVQRNGLPLRSFLPGWSAESLFTGFAPLFLLELVHEGSGEHAVWFFDHRMRMVGNHPDNLEPNLLSLLKDRSLPVLRSLTAELAERVAPALDDRTRAFLSLDSATKSLIAGLHADRLFCQPTVCRATDLATTTPVCCDDGRTLAPIDRDHLQRGLQAPWQGRIAGFVETGVTWPSPIDGHEVPAQGCLPFDDFHFACRFADRRHGLVFYVIIGDHLSRIAGIWLPALALLVSGDDLQLDLAHRLRPLVADWFVAHSLAWAEQLVPYLERGATRIASVMRAPPGLHLGHQVWNELSGIDRYLRGGPQRLPDWIALDAAHGSELYGPMDAIFPELRGHVERGVPSVAGLIAHAYANDLFLLRITDEFVSAGLRRRILDRVGSLLVAATVANTLAALDPPLAIVIGLRVENRTLTNLAGILLRIADFLSGRHPGLAIIFDGHNSLDDAGTTLASHGESVARLRPIDVERELVASVRTGMAHRPVTILDTIGAPLSASLAWTAASDGFLSIWGASLAKYRWVCNRPGYVLSNRTNLLLRAALHIYSDPLYMEAPAPIRFIDPELVTDDPEATLLVRGAPGDPGSFNFHVDVEAMLAEIGRFTDGLAEPRGYRRAL